MALVLVESHDLSSGGLYHLSLAEIAGRHSREPLCEYESSPADFIFPINEPTLKRLLRVLIVAESLNGALRSLSLAAMGSDFNCSFNGGIRAVPNDEVRAAADLDGERRKTGIIFPGLGSSPPTLLESGHTIDCPDDIVPVLSFLLKPSSVTLPTDLLKMKPDFGHVDEICSTLRFFPNGVSLSSLAEMYGTWWSHENLLRLLFLRLTVPLTLYSHRRMYAILRYGYLTEIRPWLEEYLAPFYSSARNTIASLFKVEDLPASPADLLIELSGLTPNLDARLYGAPVLLTADHVLLDFYAIGQDVQSSMVYPKHRFSSTQRSQHFEERAQEAIDHSPWKPSKPLREYKGRVLRLRGRAITDVDCIGEHNDRLLLASCKSIILTPDYLFTDHRSVNTYIDRATEAVSEWRRVVQTLLDQPRGDNYDFSAYREIIGPVCTPSLVFVPIGQCTDFIKGKLRAVVPLRELIEWLHEESG